MTYHLFRSHLLMSCFQFLLPHSGRSLFLNFTLSFEPSLKHLLDLWCSRVELRVLVLEHRLILGTSPFIIIILSDVARCPCENFSLEGRILKFPELSAQLLAQLQFYLLRILRLFVHHRTRSLYYFDLFLDWKSSNFRFCYLLSINVVDFFIISLKKEFIIRMTILIGPFIDVKRDQLIALLSWLLDFQSFSCYYVCVFTQFYY